MNINNSMKTINFKISNDAYNVLSNLKVTENLKRLEQAFEVIIKTYKKVKGGNV